MYMCVCVCVCVCVSIKHFCAVKMIHLLVREVNVCISVCVTVTFPLSEVLKAVSVS